MKKMIYIFLVFLSTSFALQSQSLDEYLVIAAENNPALKAKFKAYEASLEKVNQVGSLPNPTLDFGYFISPIETRVGPQQAKIGLMQMFPWLGTLSAKEEVFANLAKAKYELFEAEKKSLFFQVKKLWYEQYEVQQSLIILTENLKILDSYESLSTQKFETGSKSGMVDVLRIQMEKEELKNKILWFEDVQKIKKVAFNNLLNRDTSITIELPQNQEVLIINESKEGLNDSINSSNNRLKSLAFKADAFESSLVLAKKQGLPKLGIGLNYFLIGQNDMTNPDSGKDAIMPMVSISIPIYRKRYRAQQKEAELNKESVSLQIENEQNKFNTELEMNWIKYDDANRRIQLYNSQNLKAKQALEIIVSSYTNSGKDFEEILRIQRMMLGYDLKIIQAIRDNNISVAKIESLK